MQLIPAPKKYSVITDNVIKLRPSIDFDAGFEKAAEAFCGYARKIYKINLSRGEEGIKLARKPELGSSEYEIKPPYIYAASEEGANYALATFFQLMRVKNDKIYVPDAEIFDFPDCSHRALMIDFARKFHPTEYLFYYVDMCWLYKINRFQLHLTDDQAFRIHSKAFPRLAEEKESYSADVIARLVEYANDRGVILIPELDVPGHCSRLQLKYPEIFGTCGVLPASERVFDALETLYGEICGLFRYSPYIHIGGDEAAVSNWENDAQTLEYMKEHGIGDYEELYTEFIRRTTDMIFARERTPIVWEGFHKSGNDRISKNIIVISWENYYQPVTDLAESGFTIINASWRPLYIVTPDTHWSAEEILGLSRFSWKHWWEKSKAFPDGINISDKNNVIGMQLCAWGDVLQNYKSAHRAASEEFALVRERIPAAAEKNWNNSVVRDIGDYDAAYRRVDSLLTKKG